MRAELDHVVLWVRDPLGAVAFYEKVVGLEGLRVEEHRAGTVPFPSVRVSERTILDLTPLTMAPMLNGIGRSKGMSSDAAGHPVHHVCLSMGREEFQALRARLEQAGVDTSFGLRSSYGARGLAPETFYFHDLDGNVLEARYYEEGTAPT